MRAPSANQAGKISFLEKVGYGCGDLASNLVFQVIINFLQAYYTDTLLLDPARIALIFGIVRLSDAITDPLMGGVADRTHTRWGQYRPWVLWLAVPFGAAYLLAFSIGGIEEPGKSWAAFATYFLLLLVYTAINIPYGAMATAITPDPDERMSLRSWQFTMAQTGNIIVGAVTIPLVIRLGGGDDLLGFQLAIAIYAVIAVVLFVICFFSVRERVAANGLMIEEHKPSAPSARKVSVLQDLAALVRNDQWIILASIQFFLLVAVVMRGANTFYFTKYVLNAEEVFSIYLTLAAVAAVVGSVVAGRFSGGFAPRDVFVSVSVCVLVLFIISLGAGSGLMVVLPLRDTLVAIMAMMVGGVFAHLLGLFMDRTRAFSSLFVIQAAALFAIGLTTDMTPEIGLSLFVLSAFLGQVAVPVLWSMLSDCVDYGQQKTGVRNNGLVFSSAMFSLKLGVTVAGILGGLILARTGYVANQDQSSLAIQGILLAFTFIPAVCCLVVAALGLGLKLTESFVRSIQADLGSGPMAISSSA